MTETEGQIEWFRDLREAIESDPEAAIEAVNGAIRLLERGVPVMVYQKIQLVPFKEITNVEQTRKIQDSLAP